MNISEREAKKKAILQAASMSRLLDMWAISELIPVDDNVAEVRGYLMEELKSRDPEAYDRWISSENLRAQPEEFFKS